jgi:hypothetical protein
MNELIPRVFRCLSLVRTSDWPGVSVILSKHPIKVPTRVAAAAADDDDDDGRWQGITRIATTVGFAWTAAQNPVDDRQARARDAPTSAETNSSSSAMFSYPS